MKRYVLFSTPTKNPNLSEILEQLFPPEIQQENLRKRANFAFIPANGVSNCKKEYIEQ